MPVLAEEAIRGTAGIKDSQVMITWMLSTFAYPISHAIRGQRIAIPVQQSPLGRTG